MYIESEQEKGQYKVVIEESQLRKKNRGKQIWLRTLHWVLVLEFQNANKTLTSELLGWENMGWNPNGECTMLSTIESWRQQKFGSRW